MIEVLLDRLGRARELDQIVLATSDLAADDRLAEHVHETGLIVFRGSERDVLDRYHGAAGFVGADVVVRVTGDCPLVDPQLVDDAVLAFRRAAVDYASNVDPPTYPDGLDIEVFTFRHCTPPGVRRVSPNSASTSPLICASPGGSAYCRLRNEADLSGERWTVDEGADLRGHQRHIRTLQPRRDFGWLEVVQLRQREPRLFAGNRHLVRNEGSSMSSGQKLWRRAKRLIPGGSMLLSKRPEMFLPDQWPAYFSRAHGCRVWDLDGVEYIDMSLMGIGTNTLGYGQSEVDAAVRAAIDAGNMSTLNCAGRGVSGRDDSSSCIPGLIWCVSRASGGEADAIAVRIARAAAGRDKFAICGYHGWHDWYLAANLSDERNLAGHLLAGFGAEWRAGRPARHGAAL